MNNKDLFAPPSQDELQMFAAPTEEELGIAMPEEPGMLESGLAGAAQGVTFGFADEMEAAVKSALSGQLTKTEYEQQVADIRERYRKQEEANPMSFLAGNIGAGFAVPGFGMLKGGLTLGKAVKAGAAAGALAGAGGSEAQLTSGEVGELAKDVTAGTLAGAATGAAIPALAKVGKGVASFVKQQDLFESAADILSDASKGIVHSGEDILNRRADAMVAAGKKVLSQADETMQAQGDKMKSIIDRLNAKAIEEGRTINVEPVLQKFQQLDEILDIPTQKQVDFLEDVVNKAAGKGDVNTVMSALQKKVAEEQVKKIVQARKIAAEIINLEEEIVKNKTTPGLQTKMDAMKTAYKEILDSLRLSGLEDQYANITKQISSPTPFQTIIDPATNIPVGLIDTDYKTFVKASDGITKYSPEKTPAELRKMIETLNSDYVVKNIDTKQAINMRQGIKQDLQNLMFEGAKPADVQEYSAAAKTYSDLRKLMDGAKLDVIYGLGEAGKQGTDERKLYDIIKQFNREGSKEGAFFRQFVDKMKDIDPNLASKIETDVAKASRDFKLSSDLYADKAFPEKGLAFFVPSGKSLMMKGAELTGTGIYKTDKALAGARKAMLKVPTKVLESISSDNSSAIRQMADKLRGASDKTSVDLYGKLNKILEMDPNKQKAAIFALIQQPAYRDMFNYLSNEGE